MSHNVTHDTVTVTSHNHVIQENVIKDSGAIISKPHVISMEYTWPLE